MDNIEMKIVEREEKNMAIKIPITIIRAEKPEPVQQFKVEMPENEYPEPIKFKVNVVEEKQEVTKLIMKEE